MTTTQDDPLTRDEQRALVRLGHNGDCSLRFAGANLDLTPAQALELLEVAVAAESTNFPLSPTARDLAARLRMRLRDALALDGMRPTVDVQMGRWSNDA